MLRKILLLVILVSLVLAWFSNDLTRAIFEATAFISVLVMLASSLVVKGDKQSN